MIGISIVNYKNNDFVNLCSRLEQEHIRVIKEQRSPNGNCLKGLEKFKYVFIAYADRKAIGCLAMKDTVDGIAELGRLYVLPEYRNQGVASKLLNVAENQAKNNGTRRLLLDTYKRFEPAVKLYKKLCFNEITNYIEDSPYSICMKKEIQ